MANISVSLPTDGETIDASDYNTPINTIVNEFNGKIDNSNISATAAITGTKLADASVTSDKIDFTTFIGLAPNNSSITTPNGLKIKSGWVQFLGNGTNTQNIAVTFPTAFPTAVVSVVPVFIGFKSGGAIATAITDFTGKIGAGVVLESGAISLSGTTLKVSSTGTFGAAYHGISWIAIGY